MLRTGIVGLAIAAGLFAPRSIDAAATASRHTTTAAATTTLASAATFSRENFSSEELGTIDVDVFDLAMNAASCAVKSGSVGQPRTLTVIDYSRPSTEKRLWVYDLTTRRLLYEELVAHGQGTGANLATKFSNQPDSHQTSLGLFVTDETYVGRNGYSLRLDGLDKGWNDRARERAIVMHGAPYVSPAFVKANGRLGRSHGCPAVSDAVARQLIDRVKGGSLVFAYYPDPGFLKTSKYLASCGS
jgi:hypothetical protein